MKALTLIELIAVLLALVLLSGVFYCILEINSLKLKADFVKEMQDWKEWRKGVTVIINSNLKDGNLKSPAVTPQIKKKEN